MTTMIAMPISGSARLLALQARHPKLTYLDIAKLTGDRPSLVKAALERRVGPMRHRKTPGWVRTAMSAQQTMKLPGSSLLSGMDGPLEVSCARCVRHGRYGVEKLIAELGDVSVRGAMLQIAAKGGCKYALNPPAVTDLDYAAKSCQVRRAAGVDE